MTMRVLIIGGGMVGLSFGLTIRHALPDAQITVLEAKPLPTGTPDPLDSRASALNLASRSILSGLGVWADLAQQAGEIRQIHVSNQSRFGSAMIDRSDVQADSLGYVVENHHIGRTLKQKADQVAVHVQTPAEVKALDRQGEHPVVVMADGERREADLVVVADGSQSLLRDQLGISCEWRKTGQCAVVANVSFAGEQQGIAFERFTAHGPIAVLPLVNARPNQQRFNVVWSMTSDAAKALEHQSDAVFLEAFQRAFGWRLGRALQVGRRNLWPLDRVLVREQSRGGFLIAGNAAHGLHPVAGQGLNLSLRDAATLGATLHSAQVVNSATSLSATHKAIHTAMDGAALMASHVRSESAHRPLPMASALAAYERTVARDQTQIVDATDLLSTLFNRRGVLLDLPRDAALSALDLIKPLRRDIARRGTGLHALNSHSWHDLFANAAGHS